MGKIDSISNSQKPYGVGRIILWNMLALQPVASLEGHADQILGELV